MWIVWLTTNPLMQRFKETAKQVFRSSVMSMSTCATIDWQLVCVVEGMVENLLPSFWLQVVWVIGVQHNQAPMEETRQLGLSWLANYTSYKNKYRNKSL